MEWSAHCLIGTLLFSRLLFLSFHWLELLRPWLFLMFSGLWSFLGHGFWLRLDWLPARVPNHRHCVLITVPEFGFTRSTMVDCASAAGVAHSNQWSLITFWAWHTIMTNARVNKVEQVVEHKPRYFTLPSANVAPLLALGAAHRADHICFVERFWLV